MRRPTQAYISEIETRAKNPALLQMTQYDIRTYMAGVDKLAGLLFDCTCDFITKPDCLTDAMAKTFYHWQCDHADSTEEMGFKPFYKQLRADVAKRMHLKTSNT